MSRLLFLLLLTVLAVACENTTPSASDADENITDTAQPDDIDIELPETEMVEVPAGEFMMGCNEGVDTACDANETPYHSIYLSSYTIDKYEITTEDFKKCIDAGDCAISGVYEIYENDNTCNLDREGWQKHPMNCVSWFGAVLYCQWMGKRLPTEAEWEKAARGTDGRKYPWGNEPIPNCDYVMMGNDDGTGCGTKDTMPVGSKENGCSPYGACDMLGNVEEWVSDWYGPDYYATSPTNDPAGPENGQFRVLRGCSYLCGIPALSALNTYDREVFYPDAFDMEFGFRCAQ